MCLSINRKFLYRPRVFSDLDVFLFVIFIIFSVPVYFAFIYFHSYISMTFCECVCVQTEMNSGQPMWTPFYKCFHLSSFLLRFHGLCEYRSWKKNLNFIDGKQTTFMVEIRTNKVVSFLFVLYFGFGFY